MLAFVVVAALVGALAIAFLAQKPSVPFGGRPKKPTLKLSGYEAQVAPHSAKYRVSVRLSGTAKGIGDLTISLQPLIVGAHRAGLFVDEVRFHPLADRSVPATVTLLDGSRRRARVHIHQFVVRLSDRRGRTVHGPICIERCVGKITVTGLKQNSFVDPENATKLSIARGAHGTETVALRALSSDEAVGFAYLRPPMQYFRPVLSKFVGVDSWVTLLIGVAAPNIWKLLKKVFRKRKTKTQDSEREPPETSSAGLRVPVPDDEGGAGQAFASA